jgi:hypothetical protein
VISGARGVFLATFGSNGTQIFAGDNTYTGGTTICICTTLQLGNGGTTGSILAHVFNGGTLVFNRSNTYVFAGDISDDGPDPGKVIQDGTGATVLTGTNTYSNGTEVTTRCADRRQRRNRRLDTRATSRCDAGATFGINKSDQYMLINQISGRRRIAQLARHRHDDLRVELHQLYRAPRRSRPARCRSAMAGAKARSVTARSLNATLASQSSAASAPSCCRTTSPGPASSSRSAAGTTQPTGTNILFGRNQRECRHAAGRRREHVFAEQHATVALGRRTRSQQFQPNHSVPSRVKAM